MPKAPCPECDRLWREYAQTTTTHIRLTEQHRIAQLQRGRDRIKEIEALLSSAGTARDEARNAIDIHEERDHGAGDSAL